MRSGFECGYVGLLVRLWLELDRLGDCRAAACGRARMELGAEIVLLELALVEDSGDRWRAARLVSSAERKRLRDLIAGLRALIAEVLDATDAQVPAALARVQNRLFNEIRARSAPLAAQASRAG